MASRAEEAVMAEVHLADDFYLSKRERRCKKDSGRTPVPKGGGPCVLERRERRSEMLMIMIS